MAISRVNRGRPVRYNDRTAGHCARPPPPGHATPGLGALPPPAPAAQKHWAFRPPVRPAVPAGGAWAKNPIDAFILARLQKEGLKPSPEADKVTLCRRLYLDLVGLPPTPQEVDAFVKDDTPDAY